MKHVTTYTLLVLACVFWGVGFPIAKIGVEYIHPFSFAFIRFFLVSIFFILFFKLSPFNLVLKLKENFYILFFMALTGILLYGIFFLFALKFAKASDVSLISGANPIITSIVAYLILKEKTGALGVLGILISFLGVAFIVSNGTINTLVNFSFNSGDLLMLFATTMWAFYSVLTKKALLRLDIFEAVCLTSFIGSLMFLPLAIAFGHFQNFEKYPISGWLSIMYMVFFSTIFAFSAWYKGIEQIGASRSSIFVNLVPVFGVLTSIVLLKESLKLYEILGGTFVILGVILTNKKANAVRAK